MSFLGDVRGQSIQIGAILLFGFFIIGLTVNQAVVVPDQNRHVEFDHFGSAQGEMEGVRNAVINAGEAGEAVAVAVELGTTYPPRSLAVQPQRSYGSLRTNSIGGAGNELELQHAGENAAAICGGNAVTTRSVTYRPAYNYFDSVENVTYENTVTYTDGPSGERFFQTDQQLVSNDTVHLYPLLSDYGTGGSGMASITFRGGTTGAASSISGPFSVILPTHLSAADWEGLLSDEPQVASVTPVAGRDAVNVTFAGGTDYTVRCSPAGADAVPNNQPTSTPSNGGGGGNNNGSGVNPAAPGDVQLLGENIADSNAGTIDLNFSNQNENRDAAIVAARVNFFQSKANTGGSGSGGGNGNGNGNSGGNNAKEPDQLAIYNGTSGESGVLPVGETFKELDPDVIVPANQTRIIRMRFEDSSGTSVAVKPVKEGWFVLTLKFDTGESGQYFISVPDS